LTRERRRFELTAEGVRLDVALAEASGLSRTQVQRLIKTGCVSFEGGQEVVRSPNCSTVKGSVCCVEMPEPVSLELEPEDVSFDIVYEDAHLLVVNKPSGVVVHPSPGHTSGTLVHGLLKHCKDLSGIGGVRRPGIVHRLDKGTSGLLVVAKHDEAHQKLSQQFKKRTLGRIYQALVWGVPQPMSGAIEARIGRHPTKRQQQAIVRQGREALTFYCVKKVLAEGRAAHLACRLATGRTHQIRVHLMHRGHSLVGDRVYSKRHPHSVCKDFLKGSAHEHRLQNRRVDEQKGVWPYTYPALHASHLYFVHPVSQKQMRFEAAFPEDWKHLVLEMSDIVN